MKGIGSTIDITSEGPGKGSIDNNKIKNLTNIKSDTAFNFTTNKKSTTMKEATNAAVLVIDDEEMVRNDIEEILMPRKSTPENESVGLAASILFDTPSPSLICQKKPAIFPISQFTKPLMEWKALNW